MTHICPTLILNPGTQRNSLGNMTRNQKWDWKGGSLDLRIQKDNIYSLKRA
jgi:hypothetical protein